MCTLIVFVRAFAGTPLVVAANRDEQLGRPSASPALSRDDRDGRDGARWILAPRDLVAGGTWLGLNSSGVFVGITNRFGRRPNPALPSRGLIVSRALAATGAGEAAQAAASLEAGGQNGFHLIVADRREAHLVWNSGEVITHRELPRGVHIITERSFGAAPTEREPMLHRALDGMFPASEDARAPADLIDRLTALLRTHATAGIEGVCVHVPEHGYGTRSSTIVQLGARREDDLFLHADGPPCTNPHVRVALPAD